MTSPTPTPPCLGEREAVARTQIQDRIIAAFGQAAWTGDKGISIHGGKIAMSHDGWKAIRPLLDEAIKPLRTENETLREENQKLTAELNEDLEKLLASKCALSAAEAERDAAIARAEEAERLKETNRKLHRRMQIVEGPMAARVERGEREAAFWLEARKEAGRRASYALFRANRAEAEAARLTSKLAQAEGEIATMRRDASKVIAPFAACVFNDNFDVTLSTGRLADRNWVDLQRFHRALTTPEHPHGD